MKIQKRFSRLDILRTFLLAVVLTIPISVHADTSVSELFIDPNPCIASGGSCIAHVAWQSPNASAGIWMSVDEQTQTYFGCLAPGQQLDATIQSGHTYEFQAYLTPATGCAVQAPPGKLVSRVSVAAIPAAVTFPAPGAGVNIGDLLKNYLGRGMTTYVAGYPDGSSEWRSLGQRYARKQLADARAAGIPFVRVYATGFWPLTPSGRSDLELWQSDPNQYWQIVDMMMNDLDSYNIKIIPMLLGNPYQFAAMTNEKITDTLRNPQSRSYQLLKLYTTQFINRYKNRSTIAFYELSNELSGNADFDSVTRCQGAGYTDNQCATYGNYYTADVIAFMTRFGAYIRTLDPIHPLSNGDLIPNDRAARKRANPETPTQSIDWSANGLDSYAEFEKYLTDINQGMDIVSIHFYNGQTAGDKNNLRFWTANDDINSARLLDYINTYVKSLGKKLFIGEFADVAPYWWQSPSSFTNPNYEFTKNVLATIAWDKIPYSTYYAYEYHGSPHSMYDGQPVNSSVEPGFGDFIVKMIRDANTSLGVAVTSGTAPGNAHAIITWPVDKTQLLYDTQTIYVSASGPNFEDRVTKVELLVDGIKVQTLTPPGAGAPFYGYWFNIARSTVTPGFHTVTARVYSGSGATAEDTIKIQNGRVDSSVLPSSSTTPSASPTPTPTPASSPQSTPTTPQVSSGVTPSSAPTFAPTPSPQPTPTTLQGSSSVTPKPSVVPNATSVSSISELQAQLQTLLAQIAILKAQTNTPTPNVPVGTGTASCPNLVRNLSFGSRGGDVLSLQKFFVSEGLLTADSATGYFGKLTQAAVQSWQRSHNLVSSGTPATTGYGVVGPITRAAFSRCS